MASRLRSLVDLRWSDAGDFVIDSEDGDLKDTSKENMQSAIQHIQARLQSTVGDWANSPSTGAGLKRFAGQHSSAELGAQMETTILNELTRGQLFRPSEVEVHAFPISEKAIACMIFVRPAGQRETMQIAISYNLQDNKISVRN